MAILPFEKWHGTGNDFILIDSTHWPESLLEPDRIATLCHRRFGIGADGLMALRPLGDGRVEMRYFNSDGHPGSMCGNGGRCAVAFALKMKWAEYEVWLEAPDGEHRGTALNDGRIALNMQMAHFPNPMAHGSFVNTGSPHLVIKVSNTQEVRVEEEGRMWRHDAQFAPGGTNVNFWSVHNNAIRMRTFERGVEAETLSCGTGTVAVALVVAEEQKLPHGPLTIQAPGGTLEVDFQKGEEGYRCIVLSGPATHVFNGEVSGYD